VVPSWGYQLFVCGYKLMANGRFCFPRWDSDRCADLLFNVQIILGLTLVTFGTPTVTSWKVTVWGYQSVFTVFPGPILFTLLLQFLGSPEAYGKLLQKAPKMSCSILCRKLVISSLHPVQPVPKLPFSKMSCISPKWKGFGHVRFSVSSFTSSSLLGFLFCLA